MKSDRISSPEHLENGQRYHVWFSIPYHRSASGVASGVFSDVFKELTGSKDGLFLNFYERAPINWLHITAIRKWEPGE